MDNDVFSGPSHGSTTIATIATLSPEIMMIGIVRTLDHSPNFRFRAVYMGRFEINAVVVNPQTVALHVHLDKRLELRRETFTA
jgi:hypothetical protein